MNKMRVDGRQSWRPPFGRAVHVPFRSRRNGDWRWLPLLALLSLGAAVAAEDEQPSMELLEFLGSWESKTDDGIDSITLLSALLDDITAPQTQSEDKQNE